MNAPSTQGSPAAPSSVPASTTDDLARNATTRRNQQIAMWGLGGVLVMAGMWWIIASPTPKDAAAEKKDDPKAIKISTDDMVNRSMADKEWMALSENQLTTQGNQIKTLQGDSVRLDQLQKQIEDLQGQNQALKTDGSKVLSAYQTENDQLRSQISALSTQMQRPPGRARLWHWRPADLSALCLGPQRFAAGPAFR
jgi:conjugal transfer pilus assembly protein TraB